MPEREMKMLIRIFVDAFPESSLWCGDRWYDLLLIGSPQPVRVRPDEMQSSFRKPLVQADLAGIGIYSPHQLLSFHVLCPSSLAEYVEDVPPISDDWTYVDFSVPKSREAGGKAGARFTRARSVTAKRKRRPADAPAGKSFAI